VKYAKVLQALEAGYALETYMADGKRHVDVVDNGERWPLTANDWRNI
jgi:hypothetical protein